MAGTDRKRSAVSMDNIQPIIILLRPQLGENIGMVARAMLNMGLTELRLVAPKQGWPNDAAINPSSGALPEAVNVTVFDCAKDAIADIHQIWATTARPRQMSMEVQAPDIAINEIKHELQKGQKIGVMFGREATGMNNDEIVLADKIITAPLNPAFSSLNLAQAVLLVAWEWRKQNTHEPTEILPRYGQSAPASKQELNYLFEHLETELDLVGFFKTAEKKPIMARNLRNIFERSQLSSQEVRTLRGMIAGLTRRHEIPKDDRLNVGLSLRAPKDKQSDNKGKTGK
ncbi:MAG: RNA methyltransferase [Alphaproteobacteria bacterium]